jgi:dienelactone hydrolase
VDCTIDVDGVTLPALLGVPEQAGGIVVFAHGSGSSRLSPRNAHVAAALRQGGFGTLLSDLLTEHEAGSQRRVFDIGLLAARLEAVTAWLRRRSDVGALPIGYFGASTGAAAALRAAADDPAIAAVVSRGGRPDLAAEALPRVLAPTLLIVGGADCGVIELNEDAYRALRCEKALHIVPGASHLFEEPGTLDEVVRVATGWFGRHLREE